MNLFKRAIASISRNIGKTCLLFLIVLILGSVISTAISTNQATENMERNLTARMLPIAMVDFDHSMFDELRTDMDFQDMVLSPDLIRQIGALPVVRSYDFFSHHSLFARNLEEYEPETNSDDQFVSGGGPSIWFPGGDDFGPRFMIRGVENHHVLDIEQNLIELVSGRTFTREEVTSISHVAMVSEAFAQLNNLTVDSTITFRNIVVDHRFAVWEGDDDFQSDIFDEQTYDVTIIGIFRPVNLPVIEHDFSNDWWAVRELQNRIYVPNTFIDMATTFEQNALYRMNPEAFEEFDPRGFTWYQNFFTLYDPNDFPEFREGVAQIAPPYFHVVDSGNSFRPVLVALDTMRGLTVTVLIVAIAAGLLIVTLLISLFLRDRRREVGIYLALGERKRKIISQFLFEIMTVSFLAIIVALFIGNIVAANLSEEMLMSDIAVEQEREDNMWVWDPFAHMGYQTDLPADAVINSYDVSLSLNTILIFFGVGLGTVLFATIIPIIYVLRLNPKKIML